MSLSKRINALLLALAIVPAAAVSAPLPSPAGEALPPGVGSDWLDRLNPDIDAATAARIVMLDHPMGSQIRLHEGSLQPKDHPFVVNAGTASVKGMDVSGYQGNVNWSSAWANGARFAYVKATEGTYYTNPYFAQQYNGSFNVGMIRASYHFARPDTTTGAVQADYFVSHGGGWAKDGKTLPGVVDLEYNPYGATCYGLSQAGMAAWIGSFSNEYHARTTRWPVIYTSTSWWSQCVGTSANFSGTSPLWVARYASTVGTLPYAWASYTFWQFSDTGIFPGDQNLFNGDNTALVALANGGSTSQQLLGNTGFETGTAAPWTMTAGVLSNSASEPAHGGSWNAWLDGYGSAHADTVSQQIAIPSGRASATLSFYLHIDTAETSTTPYDTLNVQVYNTSGALLGTLATYSNANAAAGYSAHNLSMAAYIGKTVVVKFTGTEDGSSQTSFVLDDVTLNVQ